MLVEAVWKKWIPTGMRQHTFEWNIRAAKNSGDVRGPLGEAAMSPLRIGFALGSFTHWLTGARG
eukprot:8872318-Pyramimonas_sp.AAC.1